MTVIELINFLKNCPKEEEVQVLYPEERYGEDMGVIIDEAAYIVGTKNVKQGVYIRLG